ncbi:TRAP transporter small permease [Chloroflexota bacterium]
MSGIGQGSKTLLREFDRFSTIIERFLTIFSISLLLAMWALLLINTVDEWMDTSYKTVWMLDIVGWMVAWSIFLLMGPVARWDMHIKVNYFPTKLLGEKRGTTFIQMIENMTGLAVAIFLSIHSMRFVVWSGQQAGDLSHPDLGDWTYPVWIVNLGLFVGFVSLALFYFERTIKWIVNNLLPILQRNQVDMSEPETAAQAD